MTPCPPLPNPANLPKSLLPVHAWHQQDPDSTVRCSSKHLGQGAPVPHHPVIVGAVCLPLKRRQNELLLHLYLLQSRPDVLKAGAQGRNLELLKSMGQRKYGQLKGQLYVCLRISQGKTACLRQQEGICPAMAQLPLDRWQGVWRPSTSTLPWPGLALPCSPLF